MDINKKRIEVEERYQLRLKQRNIYPVCIKELNEDYALFMRILDLYEKHSLSEVASLIGLSEDTLEHRLYQGRFPKSFQLIRAFDRKILFARKAKFHNIYLKNVASANGRKEAMEKDLADFDKGIELLLDGKNYRTCTQEMPRFPTVYGWIVQKNLPWSFRDRNVGVEFKKINTDRLSESSNFAYLLGVYQAKVTSINPDRLTITTNEPSLAREVEKCFNDLHMKPSRKPVAFSNSKCAKRMYYDSSRLMAYISEITEGNTRIPRIFFLPDLMTSYLSGFFDARATPCYSAVKVKCSDITRNYPRITITKKDNISLLSTINSSLIFLGINSKYNQYNNPGQITIDALDSIRKCIDLNLFRCAKKVRRINELYDYWKETKELDNYGAYRKLKDEILLQRPPENGPREPGDYEKTKHPDDDDEFDEDDVSDMLEEDY